MRRSNQVAVDDSLPGAPLMAINWVVAEARIPGLTAYAEQLHPFRRIVSISPGILCGHVSNALALLLLDPLYLVVALDL